jgi:maleylacetate reductase
MPHAETHTVILPYAIAYNAPYAKEAIGKVAAAMGVDDAARGIYELCASLGGPQSLRALGFKRENLEKAADLASRASYPNPAPLEKQKLLDLLTDAYEGNPPGGRA